jgi:hypothetical protein
MRYCRCVVVKYVKVSEVLGCWDSICLKISLYFTPLILTYTISTHRYFWHLCTPHHYISVIPHTSMSQKLPSFNIWKLYSFNAQKNTPLILKIILLLCPKGILLQCPKTILLQYLTPWKLYFFNIPECIEKESCSQTPLQY